MTLDEFKAQLEILTSEGRQDEADKLIEAYYNKKFWRHSILDAVRNVSAGVILLFVLRTLMIAYSGSKEELMEWAIPMGIISIICLFGAAVPIIFTKPYNEYLDAQPYYNDLIRRRTYKEIYDTLKGGDK